MKDLITQTSPYSDIELIAFFDNKKRTIGKKRDEMLDLAKGEYLVFIDDDDRIAPDYVKIVMDTLYANPATDCVVYDSITRVNGGPDILCKYGIEFEYGYIMDGKEWRGKPAHTMVYKSSIAKVHRFADMRGGEDVEWVKRACQDIRVQTRIDKVLYFYDAEYTTTSEFSNLDAVVIRRNNEVKFNLAPNHVEENLASIAQVKSLVNSNYFYRYTVINNYPITSNAISIVMTACNRSRQTYYNLKILKNSAFKDVHIVLVDDSDIDPIVLDELQTYPFTIDFIQINKAKKTWVNPCVNYNIGFKFIKGSKVIIQNAEVCHVGDVLTYIDKNVDNNSYYVFDVNASFHFGTNDIIYQKNKLDVSVFYEWLWGDWCQNAGITDRNYKLHFLTAMSSSVCKQIGGFSYDYSFGADWDDNDLVLKIQAKNIPIITVDHMNAECGGIHLFHTQSGDTWVNNKPINNILFQKKKAFFETTGLYLEVVESADNALQRLKLLDYKSKTDVKPIKVSIACLIYKSVRWLKFVKEQVEKFTNLVENEFFFVANDACDSVLNYLKDNKINHYVHTNTDEQRKDWYINNVYRAWNIAGRAAKGEYVVFINSDMAFSPGWLDRLMDKYDDTKIVMSRLVERGVMTSGLYGIEKNFGNVPGDYKEDEFVSFSKLISEDKVCESGLYMPCLIKKKYLEAINYYPEGNIVPGTDIYNPVYAKQGEHCMPGDHVFIKRLNSIGIQHYTVFNSIVYHFQEGEMRDTLIEEPQKKFTIEIMSGFCNVLKSFITALSIGDTNIRCRNDVNHPTNYAEILDDKHICHGTQEYGEPFTSCRFLILKQEHGEQKHLENEFNDPGALIDLPNRKLHHLFSPITIDWFYDRSYICDKVYNRIMRGKDKIHWRPEILQEVNVLEQTLIHPVLTVNIRTWTHKYDPSGLTQRTDEPCRRRYDFETYRTAIEKFLPYCKTILLSADNEDVLPHYVDLLKGYNIVIYKQKEGITDLQFAAINMLLSSKCDYMVCSRLSTFSECIWWFSHCRQQVIPLF